MSRINVKSSISQAFSFNFLDIIYMIILYCIQNKEDGKMNTLQSIGSYSMIKKYLNEQLKKTNYWYKIKISIKL